MRGASLGASVNGEELASPRFDPFWKKAEELAALVFIHPQGVPQLASRLQGNGFLANVIGNPLETTIALSHLIFEGTFDKFPGLRICGAHAGGFMPSYNGRFDQGCVAFPANCNQTLKRRPSEYLKQCYFDSMVFTTEGLRHLVEEYGASHIVMGTDYPFPWTTTSVDHILNTPGLSDADRTAILGGNLVKLLGLAIATAPLLSRWPARSSAVRRMAPPDRAAARCGRRAACGVARSRADSRHKARPRRPA